MRAVHPTQHVDRRVLMLLHGLIDSLQSLFITADITIMLRCNSIHAIIMCHRDDSYRSNRRYGQLLLSTGLTRSRTKTLG